MFDRNVVMKLFFKTLGSLIWALGGGLLLSGIFIGIPVLIFFFGISFILTWVWNSAILQIIATISIGLFLLFGFTEKVNNPLH
jgi:hypothetical protein